MAGDGPGAETVFDSKAAEADANAETMVGGPALSGTPSSLREWQSMQSHARSTVMPAGMELGQRYRVVRLLGQGGMGAVYQVYDKELEREAALKLIRPERGDNPEVLERFKREIQLSSKITHPNVLRVYDLGEIDGVRFLTMQFVDGEDLSSKVKREGRLPLQTLLDVFRQICLGLAAAHKEGVTHRDLKPQNVMLDRQGRVYVMDFGLAQSAELSSMTQTGMTLGTPHYMSPEQVLGEKTDHLTDIYALGVILYELATGELPFRGESAYQVMVQRLQRAPRPAVELNPELPGYLLKVLDKCLMVKKELRYQSVDEILADLEQKTVETTLGYELKKRTWLRWAALVPVAALLGWGAYALLPRTLFRGGSQAEQVKVPVVAVANFTVPSGDAGVAWYGPGIARLVADNLSGSKSVRVASMARMEVLQAGGPQAAALMKLVAKEGVEYLLTGEVLPGPGGLTLSARLIQTGSGEQMAARRIDRLTPEKLLASADEIALEVRRGLNLPLTEKVDFFGADIAARSPAAYQAYVDGLRALRTFDYEAAEKAFRLALEKSPEFTMARYRLATVLMTTSRSAEALEAIHQAVAESGRLPERYARSVRAVAAWYEGRNAEAIAQLQQMVAAYPYEAEPRYFLATLYAGRSKHAEAVEQLKVLAQLDPEQPYVYSMLGDAYMKLKDFNQSITALMKYSQLEPANANANEMLGNCYRSQGEFDLAIEEYKKALTKDPHFHYASHGMGVAQALKGDAEGARSTLAEVVSDQQAPARLRLTAAFDLASLYRAGGQFGRVDGLLGSMAKQLAAEKVRESMALAVRGLSAMELGDLAGAERLTRQAIQKSPGVATRYLFARGLVEVRQKRYEAARATAAEILKGALPADNPDRTENKAAGYLTGLALLEEGKAAAAVEEISKAVALSGYEYGNYHLGLARAYLAAGRQQEALAAVKSAAAPLDPVKPRLDLELDRVRALLVAGQVYQAMGRQAQAAGSAQQFVEAWKGADRGLPELAEAGRLAAAGK